LKKTIMLSVVVLAGMAHRVTACAALDETVVTVHLVNDGVVPWAVLSHATAIAAKVFTAAGVRTDWRFGGPSGRQSHLAGTPVVRMATRTPGSYLSGALGSTLPFLGQTTVFYDRICPKDETPFTATLLAHVLVHEIAHVLEGILRHSATGIMKANWTGEDRWDMIHERLSFAPEDLDLIRRGLASRAATLKSLSGGKTAVPKPNQFRASYVQCRY
jgi:hypothetical protein